MQTMLLRRKFLEYFKKKGHILVPSSSVVPHDDPTLLFINAGMNQFKDVFLGTSQRDYKRAASSQKCIRVGGKHNDLENVGHTRRHLTFFEMLGNFSFGDYFKKEAIQFAWEVSTEVFGFDPEKIWPTVFTDDDEAFELWTAYVPAKRITRFGEKENFWAMGEHGPCGPCSELLYDRGEQFGSAENPLQDSSGERFLEFWNLVFMQFNKLSDGRSVLLPNPSIDTGSGLERVAMLLENGDTVFETDILKSLISEVEKISGQKYLLESATAPAFRVIADHMRTLAFAIADGVQPSNVDRGYVLRKVLRRAVRYARQLHLERPFLSELLPALIEKMGADYPELILAKERISDVVTVEEEAFLRTLRRGGNLLNQVINAASSTTKKISGEEAFKLKDTYGMPIEEIVLLAKDSQLSIDLSRYEELEKEAKEKSRSSAKTTAQIAEESAFAPFLEKNGSSKFLGYTQLSAASTVKALIVDGQFVEKMQQGQQGQIILDCSSFYAEMGGQIGDRGVISHEKGSFTVHTTKAPFKGIISHVGVLESGTLQINDQVQANVDAASRQQIANNHTATHLLHWALQVVLGSHIKQAGSLVNADRLRFDFSHHKAPSSEELVTIEDLVNEKIRENGSVTTYEVPFEEVQKQSGIKQFFGEKYGTVVRVVDISDGYSKELCGGTHTQATGTIGVFALIKESGIAAGIRRIEAVTGHAALQHLRQGYNQLDVIAKELKTTPPKIEEKISKIQEENNLLQEKLKKIKDSQMQMQASALVESSEKGEKFAFITNIVNVPIEDLALLAEITIKKLGSGVVVLGAQEGSSRCHIAVRVTEDISQQFSAADLIKNLAPFIQGSGGGKAQSAQAGGKDASGLEKALDAALQKLRN